MTTINYSDNRNTFENNKRDIDAAISRLGDSKDISADIEKILSKLEQVQNLGGYVDETLLKAFLSLRGRVKNISANDKSNNIKEMFETIKSTRNRIFLNRDEWIASVFSEFIDSGNAEGIKKFAAELKLMPGEIDAFLYTGRSREANKSSLLLAACKHEDERKRIEIIRSLIESGSNINQKNGAVIIDSIEQFAKACSFERSEEINDFYNDETRLMNPEGEFIQAWKVFDFLLKNGAKIVPQQFIDSLKKIIQRTAKDSQIPGFVIKFLLKSLGPNCPLLLEIISTDEILLREACKKGNNSLIRLLVWLGAPVTEGDILSKKIDKFKENREMLFVELTKCKGNLIRLQSRLPISPDAIKNLLNER